MLGKAMIGLIGAAGAAMLTVAVAGADPEPAPPPPPNVNNLPPVSPVAYSVLNDRYYAFGTADGLVCAIDRGAGSYGCSGPIPNAPGGANIISGGASGAPDFASSPSPFFQSLGPVQQLPANTRLSYRTVSCTTDGASTTICINTADQTGFVLSPGGSYALDSNPLTAPREGRGPFAN